MIGDQAGAGDRPLPDLRKLDVGSLLAARPLPSFAEASVLERVEPGPDGREHFLAPDCAAAWRSLRDAALADGIPLSIISGFRSVSRQAEIIHRKLAAGQSLAEILTVSAPPGFSEHHTGRAIDIATPDALSLEIDFENTPAFRWLCANAAHFGFSLSYPRHNPHGFQYEPWHWRFHPERLATGTP